MEKQKYTKAQHKKVIAIGTEKDDVKRWRMIHDLLRETNPKARREQDKQAREMQKVRDEKLYNQKLVKEEGGLIFRVSLPRATYSALVESDLMLLGKSILLDPQKARHLDPRATNKIARKLSRAFPEYRVS